MTARRSIQGQLITAVIVSQLLLAGGLAALSMYSLRRQLRTAFDAGLQGRSMSIAALVRYSEDEPPKLMFDSELAPRPLDTKHPDAYKVYSSDGKFSAQSPNWKERFDRQTPRQFWHVTIGGTSYRAVRMAALPVLDSEGAGTPAPPTLTVMYAAPTEEMDELYASAGLYLGIGSLVLLAATAGLALWGIRRGLFPLQALANSAASVSPVNWELQVSEEAQTTAELGPLTQAMTSMLRSLQKAFTQQREFLTNAAHELKTPVAILKSTLQSLLHRPRQSEEYRAGIEKALEDMARLEKLLHSMLRLARAEQWAMGNLQRDLPEIELGPTCQSAMERLQPFADMRGVKLEFANNGPVRMRADTEDLELVWANLLENAVRYSPAGETVRITVRSDETGARVAVEDRGQGIPKEEVAKIFDRFHRGDQSRTRDTGGYGLGLAIANAIVETYGGTICVEATGEEGTTMAVRFRRSC